MKPRKPPPEQDDLLRARLVEMIDMRHELVKLAVLIDWDIFDRGWAGFFPSHTGRPATSPRLVAGLLYLQDAFALSDEAVVARWRNQPVIVKQPENSSFRRSKVGGSEQVGADSTSR